MILQQHNLHQPYIITQDDNQLEDTPPQQHQYNLLLRASLLADSVVPSPVPAPHVHLTNAIIHQPQPTPHSIAHIHKMYHAIIDETIGTPLEYQHLIKQDKYREMWVTFFANELGCLPQGIRDVKGTNTIQLILHSAIPPGHTDTYGCIVVDYCPNKQEPN